ncbi:hypothetical protein BJX99DRAFT_261577 [Aspergillus californicus]
MGNRSMTVAAQPFQDSQDRKIYQPNKKSDWRICELVNDYSSWPADDIEFINQPLENTLPQNPPIFQEFVQGHTGGAHLVDAINRSPIWDDGHRVLGFVRYAPQTGRVMDWCMAVAADSLVDGGYKMARSYSDTTLI